MKTTTFLLLLLVFPLAASAEEPLTNAAVIELGALGLSEEVQVAKVGQAKATSFDLSLEGLRSLKASGVPQSVIAAMLRRSQVKTPPTPARDGITGGALEQGEEKIPLPLESGIKDHVGGMFFTLIYLNYPGMQSKVRTREPIPTFLFSTGTSKKIPVFLVRLDPDDDEGPIGARSLKLNRGMAVIHGGEHAGAFHLPDPDWDIDITVEQLSEREYRVRPKEKLKAGEYGFYIPIGVPNGGGLYSFGVD